MRTNKLLQQPGPHVCHTFCYIESPVSFSLRLHVRILRFTELGCHPLHFDRECQYVSTVSFALLSHQDTPSKDKTLSDRGLMSAAIRAAQKGDTEEAALHLKNSQKPIEDVVCNVSLCILIDSSRLVIYRLVL